MQVKIYADNADEPNRRFSIIYWFNDSPELIISKDHARAPVDRDENQDIMFGDEDVDHQLRHQRPQLLGSTLCLHTSNKYGDMGGRLTISSTGQFAITCECTPAWDQEGVLEETWKIDTAII